MSSVKIKYFFLVKFIYHIPCRDSRVKTFCMASRRFRTYGLQGKKKISFGEKKKGIFRKFALITQRTVNKSLYASWKTYKQKTGTC